MRRFAVPAAITVVAIVLLALLAFGINHSGANNSIAYSVASKHYEVPPNDDALLPTLSGESAKDESLKGYRGKLVLVNYFASWCVPCQAEAPVLKQAENVLKAHGGTVLGIAFSQSPTQARTYLRRYGLTYPAVTDPAGDVAESWGIGQVPDSFLIDREGRVVWLNTYQLTQSFLNKTLPQLISQYA